jgi:hypothetical protein
MLFAGALIVLSAASAGASQRQPPQGPPQGQPPGMPDPSEAAANAGQIQRLFEGYMVMQAQDALQLSEGQYGRFVTRLKALQDVRRRHQLARNRIIADIRRLTNPQNGPADEAILVERLRSLREEDDRAAADMKKAYDGVDETLDVRQQARFRIFEERMEQQKLELLMKARQNARAAGRGRGKS